MLAISSLVAALICGWLTVMYVLLRHDGWQWRAVLTAVLVGYCVVSLFAAERVVSGVWLERMLLAGAAAASCFAATALWSMLASSDFDGFWIPVAAALFVQSGLSIAVFAPHALLNRA